MNYGIPAVSGPRSRKISGPFFRPVEASWTGIYSFRADLSIEKLYFVSGADPTGLKI